MCFAEEGVLGDGGVSGVGWLWQHLALPEDFPDSHGERRDEALDAVGVVLGDEVERFVFAFHHAPAEACRQ